VTDRARRYEDLLDALMGMLEVLHEAQLPPNDAFMAAVKDECDSHGYEIPGSIRRQTC